MKIDQQLFVTIFFFNLIFNGLRFVYISLLFIFMQFYIENGYPDQIIFVNIFK